MRSSPPLRLFPLWHFDVVTDTHSGFSLRLRRFYDFLHSEGSKILLNSVQDRVQQRQQGVGWDGRCRGICRRIGAVSAVRSDAANARND